MPNNWKTPMCVRFAIASMLAITCSAAIAQEKPVVTPMPVIIVQEPTPPAPVFTTKLSLPNADGSQTREYLLADFSLSVSRGMSYGVGDPRAEASATLSIAGGLDELLLQWASQATIDTQQSRKLTVRSDKPDAPKVYELDGARVLGLNLTGGSYNAISLQVGLTGLTIDGVKMN